MIGICRFLCISILIIIGLMPLESHCQNFINSGLEDTIAISTAPDNWTAVPFTDAASLAAAPSQTLPDVCGLLGPGLTSGVHGNPISGNSFVSGLQAAPNASLYYHEGIQQTVNGFNTALQYQICFYQTVVKQSNCIDTSGSWAVYMDNILIGTSSVSTSTLPFSSNFLIWDFESMNFTPTSASHTFKFMPKDDDSDAFLSYTHPGAALRMGIDSVFILPILPCNLTLNIGPDTSLCIGDSIALIDTNFNGYNYLWSNGSTDSLIYITTPGTYWLQADSSVCTYSDTIVVSAPANFSIGNDTTICFGESLIIDATTPNSSYLWNTLSTDSAITITTAGNYYVDIDQNGCGFTDSLLVSHFPIPNLDLGNDTTLCLGETLYLDATTPLSSYLWNDGSTNPDFTISIADTVSIILSQNNCQYYDTIVVDYFSPISQFLGNDSIFCLGDSIILGPNISASNYLWSNGSTDSSTTFYSADTVWLELVQNGCIYRDSAILTNFPVLNLNLGNDTSICLGTSLIIDGTSPSSTYLWNTLSTDSAITITAAGNYYVDVYQNGCLYSDSILVSYIPIPSTDLGNDTTLCAGATLYIDATTPLSTYIWNNGTTNPDLTISSSDTVSLILSQNNCQYFDTIIVDYFSPISQFLGNDSIFCLGDSITLGPNVTGSIYLWSNGSTDSSTTFYIADTLWLEITENGCEYRDSVILTNYPTLNLSIGNDTSICLGSSLIVDATSPSASYLWNTMSTDSAITINTAGNYYVDVYKNGCLYSDSIEVTYIPVPTLTLGNDTTLCSGATLYIDATAPLSTYLWNTGSTNPDITVSSADTISLILNQNNCQYYDTIIVDYFSASAIELGNDTTLCPNESLTITLQNNSAIYLWSDMSTDSSITVSSSGIYWVEANDHGCTISDTIMVQYSMAPVLDLGPDTVLCNSDILSWNITQQNASYLWFNNSISPVYSTGSGGIVWATLTDSNNCQVVDSIDITHINLDVDLGPDLKLCEGETVELNADQTIMANYLWQDNSTDSTYLVSVPGLYSVTATSLSCQSSDSVNIEYVTIIADFISDSAVCQNEIVDFHNISFTSANDSIQSYYWEFGDLTNSNQQHPSHLYNSAGAFNIKLIINSYYGCTETVVKDNFITIYQKPKAEFTYSLIDDKALEPQYLFESTSSNSDVWLWKINKESVGNSENYIHTFSEFATGKQEVTLIVTNDFGCTDTISQFIAINELMLAYVPNAFTPFDKGNLNNIFLPVFTAGFESRSYHLTIFNRWGEIVFESMNKDVGWNGMYGGQSSEFGTYVWQIDYRDINSSEDVTITGTVNLIR